MPGPKPDTDNIAFLDLATVRRGVEWEVVAFVAVRVPSYTEFSPTGESKVGVWLGGVLYDQTGSYNIVWYISIALGVFAALINLPVDEREIRRGHTAAVPNAV